MTTQHKASLGLKFDEVVNVVLADGLNRSSKFGIALFGWCLNAIKSKLRSEHLRHKAKPRGHAGDTVDTIKSRSSAADVKRDNNVGDLATRFCQECCICQL